MRLKYLTCFLFLLIAQGAMGQMTIKGKVIGKDDELPLPQVTVLIDSTKNGVATNNEGEFEITIPINSTLVFRYLGYITQKVKPMDDEFLLIKLKPECFLDHFDTKYLNLSAGIDLKNNQLGVSADYILRYQLPVDFKASVSYYSGQENHNLDTNLSILDLVHSCEFELEANFRYQSVDMSDYEFQNSSISIEPNFNGWYPSIGIGFSNIQDNNSLSRKTGFLIGLGKVLDFDGTYIPLNISTTIWEQDLEINISAEYQFHRSLTFKTSYQKYRDFNAIIASLGIEIRTWKKPF